MMIQPRARAAVLALLTSALFAASAAAQAQAKRQLEVVTTGVVVAIQLPGNAAMQDILPSMPGYESVKVTRFNQIRVVTQTLIGGTADIGGIDPPTTLAAVEAGAKLKIVGKLYDKTSLVFLANSDRVATIADLAKPSSRVSIGGRGEVTHIMLVEPLLRRKIDFSKMNIIEMPGSGTRVAALLSGKIDAGPLQFDQVEAIIKKGGPYKTLIEPWKEFPSWINEVWVVRADWLAKPENERALVDFLKATITAFRRANSDFDWFLDRYRKLGTGADAKTETAANLKPIWERLRSEVKAWPADGAFNVKEFNELAPAYKASDAIRGTVKMEDVVEPKYMQQALRELR